MMAEGPMVMRPGDGITPPGPQTPGMERRQLLEHEDRWIGWVRTEPGVASGWHHHGDRDTYIFPLAGTITIEYGAGGRERMMLTAGDVGFVPAQTVHREITGAELAGEAFVLRIGSGPQNVNVDGPDPLTA
jgi:uncharacterized RmlC-like cupin family protein